MQNNKVFKETFKNLYSNAAEILAAGHVVVEDRINAEKDNNLPHNALVVINTSAVCKVAIWLDNFSNTNEPDYIIFPTQQMTITIEEGIAFTTLFFKNLHAVTAVAINELKVRVSTVKLVVATQVI